MTQRSSDGALEGALERWQRAGIITGEQAGAIRELERQSPQPPLTVPAAPERARISLATLIIAIGAVLVVVASAVFVGIGWSSMGRIQQFVWATFAVVLPWGAAWLMRRNGSPLAVHGSAYLIALGNVALLLFGYTLFRLAGIWPDETITQAQQDNESNLIIFTEAFAMAVAAVIAFRLRIPFMLLLAGILGWVVWFEIGNRTWVDTGRMEPWGEALYGFILIAVGFVLARLRLRQHAFWLFLVGLSDAFIFMGTEAFSHALGPAGLVYLVMAVAAILVSVWLEFRVFLLFGAVGLYGWVSALIIDTFGGSQIVAFLLILVGAVIVALGLAWQRWLAPWWQRRQPAPPTTA